MFKKQTDSPTRAPSKLAFLLLGILLVLSSLLVFWNLSKPPFTDYDEAIYAEVLASTVQHPSFLILYDDGHPWFHKPPLYFWSALTLDDVLHNPELSYRLPAAFFGLLGIILITAITFELSGNAYVAALAGFILAGTGDFIESARQLRIETGVIAAILFTFYCYLRSKKDKRWLMGILVGVALGIMFKSIIGTLGLCVIIIFSLYDMDFTWLKNAYFWIGGALGILIVAPWHLYETYTFGFTFWQDYLFHQVLKRFVSNVNGTGHPSNWIYLRDTYLFAFPWGLTFLAGILSSLDRRFLGERYRLMLALVTSICFIFLVFALAQTKIPYYVLPAIVFFPIVTALLFECWYKRCQTLLQKRLFGFVLVGLLAVGLANSIYVGFHYQPDFAVIQSTVYDERAIGLVLAGQPSLPIAAFYYPDWDTIRYYSNDKDAFTLIQSGYSTTSPVYMIMVTSLYKNQPFGSAVMAQLKPLYVGTWLTLLRFHPSAN